MKWTTLVKLVLIAGLASTYVFGYDPDPGPEPGNNPVCTSGDGKQKCDSCPTECWASQTQCGCVTKIY